MPETFISVVDDDLAMREALDGLFRSAGFRVRTFASAEEFLRSRAVPKTSCLVLDVDMPGMSGVELQRKLLHHANSPPVIFISGHYCETQFGSLAGQGVAGFFEKPFNDDELLLAVETVLSGRRP